VSATLSNDSITFGFSSASMAASESEFSISSSSSASSPAASSAVSPSDEIGFGWNGVAATGAVAGAGTCPGTGRPSGPSTGGAAIVAVASGGPAAGAGLRAGDVITEVDGKSVSSPDEVAGAVESHQPGDQVQVKVLRSGGRVSFTVELGDRP